MSKVEKLLKKPKIRKFDITHEDCELFSVIFSENDVISKSNTIEVDLFDNLIEDPNFGDEPIKRKTEELHIYKGETEDLKNIFVIEHIITEGDYGFGDGIKISENEVDEDEVEDGVLKIEDPELECDWIEKTVTVNNYWYVIPTINLKLVKQIVPYIIQNINGI